MDKMPYYLRDAYQLSIDNNWPARGPLMARGALRSKHYPSTNCAKCAIGAALKIHFNLDLNWQWFSILAHGNERIWKIVAKFVIHRRFSCTQIKTRENCTNSTRLSVETKKKRSIHFQTVSIQDHCYWFTMGNTQPHNKTGRKVVEQKLENARKTGVLSLSEHKLESCPSPVFE